MVTTIVAGTLTVTITEAVVLNDADSNDQGVSSTNQFTIGAVAKVVRRIVPISTTETGLLAFAADLLTAPGTPQSTYVAGHHDLDNVRYIRITNKDDTNFVTLVFKSSSGAEFAVLVDKGQSFIYTCDDTGGAKLTMDASSTALTVALEDLADVTAIAGAGSVDLEVFVASV